MDLRWILLPVFMAFVEAENVTVVKATLGQNATFTCSVNTTEDTYWYIEIRSQVKGPIGRTFGSDDALYDIHTTLKTKYVAMGNVFVVTNITAEDCRLYFCARKEGGNITFRDTFHLVSDDPVTPSTINNTEGNDQQHHITMLISDEVIYSSLALNILLIFVIIGMVFTSLFLKRKKSNRQATDPTSIAYENRETLETPQYEEIQLRNLPPADVSSEALYYKVQLPRSTLPPPHHGMVPHP